MVLKFTGSSFFRQRLILSTLSGKSIVIRDIRIDSDKPGLTGAILLVTVMIVNAFMVLTAYFLAIEAEASVLRLLEKVTNGCKIEIDYTGTFSLTNYV
jgi:RNA 3'-terminal phosphate cyclase-like protein